ncbi:SDR family NAD(P)-dependent oxidoreductase [Nocardia sp. alder85J]|uniref:SDR family NAD(P)-dependent oxidoreductase n=1 Tax=Nocardia sp. alder85J TaxID=2862949 RepID=UPI001CD44F4B|nr:SDR family NAD(P)-dependent oxidoreductase [Nocardia sp. alder85J]MCX4095763.1 SDR family NAD(P)-dependent oxidoreductase [Nocardia sp. alder85J]
MTPAGPAQAALNGRVALVTGAGRGLGASHAAALAAAGAAVVVNDPSVSVDGTARDAADVACAVVETISAAGGIAVVDRSDVSSFTGAERAVACALHHFGRLDIVVNNAGIMSASAVTELSQEEFQRSLATNVTGSVGVARAAFASMRDRGYGRIVNTLSEAALAVGYHAGTAYAASKAALWGATMALADEGAPWGITVNAISPGARTRMSRDHLERVGSTVDLDPAHVSKVVLALVDESAGDITGRVVHAAGGAIREYRLQRHIDTPLVPRLEAAQMSTADRKVQ